MLFSLLGTVLTGVVTSFFSDSKAVDSVASATKDWIKDRGKADRIAKQHKIKIEEAKVQARIEKLKRDTKLYGDADTAAIAQWSKGYKDEVLTYSLVILMVSMFVPSLQPYVKVGVDLLNALPIWIQVIVAGTYISVLGIRFMLISSIKDIFSKSR